MYSLWWTRHIVPTHVSKVAKSMRVVCENIARVQKFLILWRFKIWGDLIHFTHNHNCLMGTIIFEVYHITPTSPRNTHATLSKAYSFCFSCSLHIFLLSISYTITSMAFMNHTQIFYDWWVLVVRWLFMSFS